MSIKNIIILLSTIFSLSIYSSDQIEVLAVDVLEITEQIPEIQVDSFEEDTETVTYWHSNAMTKDLVIADSLVLSTDPCENGETEESDKKDDKDKIDYDSRLALFVRYNSRSAFDKDLPMTASPAVGSYLNKIFREPANLRPMTLAKAKDELSFAEKLKLASYIGSRFSANYDYDRAANGTPESEGIVTLDELIEGYKKGDRSGVCRDIAIGQVQVLNQLGLDCKVTSYTTASAGGHATVNCVDPNDPDTVVKINYGEVTGSDQAGSVALNQAGSIPDVSIAYQLYDQNGNFVSSIDTQLGKVFAEVSGAKAQDLDWQESFDNSIAQVQVFNYGNLFYGQTVDGHTVAGIASSIKFDEQMGKLNFSGNVGGAFAHVDTEDAPGNEQFVTYLRGHFDLGVEDIRLTDRTYLDSGVRSNQAGAIHFGAGENNKNDSHSRFTFDLNPYARVNQDIGDRALASIEVGQKYELGWKESRDVSQGYGLTNSENYVHTELDYEVTRNLGLSAYATIVNRESLGTTGRVGLGATGQKFQTNLVYDTRLDDSTPGYVPGATPTVSIIHEQQVGDTWFLEGQTSQVFTGAKERMFIFSVKKTF